MNKEASEFVARVAFKATAELTCLIPLVKEYATNEDEYELIRKSITSIARKVHEDILNKIFLEYPDIEETFDQSIKEFGRLS